MSTRGAEHHHHTVAEWQMRTAGTLGGSFDRRTGGPGGLGGWWLGTEVDIVLDGRGYRPDIAGWRRDRVAEAPRARPVTIRPDWLCEIVSESNRAVDTVIKPRRLRVGVLLGDDPDDVP